MDREESPTTMEAGEATLTGCMTEESNTEMVPHSDAPDSASPYETYDQNVAPTPEQIVEALLFATDAPLSPQRLSELADIGSVRTVRQHVDTLNKKYAHAGLAFRIEEIAKGYQMLTLPAYQPWVAKLNKASAQTRLTGAALETLSIVAYKQPVIRADIEAIRGVSCGEVLNRLREMGLIKIFGRAEIVGRPILYGTTKKFLDVFGLADLDDLPPMESLMSEIARRKERESDQPGETDEPEIRAAASA